MGKKKKEKQMNSKRGRNPCTWHVYKDPKDHFFLGDLPHIRKI